MFRLKASGLPDDPIFPESLDALGYTINDADEIVSKQYSKEHFRFYSNQNARYNELRREAFHTAIRKIVIDRLRERDIFPLHLPQLTTDKPELEPHTTILTTKIGELLEKDLIIVINLCDRDDLGIFSWRTVAKSGGINAGSVIGFVDEVIARCSKQGREDKQLPGFIILNPGQRLYSHTRNAMLTNESWDALPRESLVHDGALVYNENQVAGHLDPQQHVESVFAQVIDNPKFVRKDAKLLALGVMNGGTDLATYLDKHWEKQSTRMVALALMQPNSITSSNPQFANFLRRRTRAWVVSDHALGTVLSTAEGDGFPDISGGADTWAETIITSAQKNILMWFEEVYQRLFPQKDGVKLPAGSYSQEDLVVAEAVLKEIEEAKKATKEPMWEGDEDYVDQGVAERSGSLEGAEQSSSGVEGAKEVAVNVG